MAMMTYLNPFKALREAQKRIERMEADSVSLHRRLASWERVVREIETEVAAKDSRIKRQKEEIVRLTAIVENSQPRDPKTGRIIPKGALKLDDIGQP